MSQTGLGVTIQKLRGNASTVAAFEKVMGKRITEIRLDVNDALRIKVADGSQVKLFDNGQYCCEQRYMRTDDDLSAYVGAVLMGAEVKDGPSTESGLVYHDVQFLEIQTDRGVFTMASHNEHNGYYGGFSIDRSFENLRRHMATKHSDFGTDRVLVTLRQAFGMSQRDLAAPRASLVPRAIAKTHSQPATNQREV